MANDSLILPPFQFVSPSPIYCLATPTRRRRGKQEIIHIACDLCCGAQEQGIMKLKRTKHPSRRNVWRIERHGAATRLRGITRTVKLRGGCAFFVRSRWTTDSGRKSGPRVSPKPRVAARIMIMHRRQQYQWQTVQVPMQQNGVRFQKAKDGI